MTGLVEKCVNIGQPISSYCVGSASQILDVKSGSISIGESPLASEGRISGNG